MKNIVSFCFQKYVDCTVLETENIADAEDSSYDSDYEAEDSVGSTNIHSQVELQVFIQIFINIQISKTAVFINIKFRNSSREIFVEIPDEPIMLNNEIAFNSHFSTVSLYYFFLKFSDDQYRQFCLFIYIYYDKFPEMKWHG